jgi:4-amino-4-deoxy-L-arabinose transferase-like glycosyltransferase
MTEKRYRLAFAGFLSFFVLSRCWLQLGLTPYFEVDTYKYLGGADALWGGDPLPPVFTTLPVTGGALHAVPGYAWLIELVWSLNRAITLRGLAIFNSMVSLGGIWLAASLARRWIGRGAAVAVLGALVLSPSIAWLEHTVMPDALAVPLMLLTAWLSASFPPENARWVRSAAVGALCGVVMSLGVVLRTSSQAFLPIPVALAFHLRRGWRALGLWLVMYAVGLVLPTLPWVLENHQIHGVYRLTASTGRQAYFSALYSNTVNRRVRARELRVRVKRNVLGSFHLSDLTFQRLLERDLSFPEADAEMGRMTLEAYRSAGPTKVIQGRFKIFAGLFTRLHPTMHPLRSHRDKYLENPMYAEGWRSWAESRFAHPLSPELRAAMEREQRDSPLARGITRPWIQGFTLEGLLLLGLYLLSLPVLLLLGGRAWPPFWTFAAGPLLFLGAYTIFGAPLYRYQAALHPLMLASVVVAAFVAGAAIRARRAARGAG